MRYDNSARRVIIEPVEMTQEFRKFEFKSPWETFPAFRDQGTDKNKLIGDKDVENPKLIEK